jgi:N-acetylglucosaminyl-diphospho-decaprenol L-rhamnosyltransferase
MQKLTVIFVTFNSYAVISNCLAQLVDDPSLKIIVVDNNSNDGTPSLIKADFPSVEVIAQKQNLGYGRAANVVLRNSDTPHALLLNPDLTTTPADIRKLWDYAENDASNTAIWGPATLSKDFTGEPPEQVEWISGSAMLFDVAKIKQVGLFDENIFLFSEETDLCERTIRSGYTIKFCRSIFFNHLVGQGTASSPKIEYLKWWHFGWSQCYRMVKNGHVTYFRNPTIKHIVYRIHSVTSRTHAKRMKWRAKADGALAYIRGVKAFRADGTPQMS